MTSELITIALSRLHNDARAYTPSLLPNMSLVAGKVCLLLVVIVD
jgi:hypothetical protein